MLTRPTEVSHGGGGGLGGSGGGGGGGHLWHLRPVPFNTVANGSFGILIMIPWYGPMILLGWQVILVLLAPLFATRLYPSDNRVLNSYD